MNVELQNQTKTSGKPDPVRAELLQRTCACGQHTIAGEECAECRQKREGMLLRAAVNAESVHAVPPIVHEALNSSGQPLDAETRAFMEPGFGYDFSQVRVHGARPRMIQNKLTVNEPGDEYEQEADRVAEQVMRMPDVSQEEVQAFTVTSEVQTHIDSLRESGQVLPGSVRAFFEPRFGYDFSHVRVHADALAAETAKAVNARAYTVGRDIVFGAGQYAPERTEARALLAHELAHVVQQQTTATPAIYRKIDTVARSGCTVNLGMNIGIYGSRATDALAAQWQNWINTLWRGTAACHGNSTGVCATRVNATVKAHPKINWWWEVPESNSAFVREPGYRSMTNTLIDSGDWAENEDDRSIAHEVGHLMGQGEKYWRLPFMGGRSESGFINDIMANYYQDPGPTEYGPALTRILEDHNIDCPCCLKYPPCSENNCALNPGLPCAVVGERRHCEWIRSHNTPEALANYPSNCSMLAH